MGCVLSSTIILYINFGPDNVSLLMTLDQGHAAPLLSIDHTAKGSPHTSYDPKHYIWSSFVVYILHLKKVGWKGHPICWFHLLAIGNGWNCTYDQSVNLFTPFSLAIVMFGTWTPHRTLNNYMWQSRFKIACNGACALGACKKRLILGFRQLFMFSTSWIEVRAMKSQLK